MYILESDCLAEPQTTNPLIVRPLYVHGNELRLFWAEAFSHTHAIIASEISTVSSTFNVLSYDTVWSEYRTH